MWKNIAPLVHWFLLAAGAGLINTGGFLACRRFVSHVTGFATMHGIDLAEGNWAGAVSMAFVPLYFLLGCMFSAWVVDRRIQRGLNPLYSLPLGTIVVLLVFVAVAGGRGLFGVFGEYDLKANHLLLALLCLACGIQNAVVSTATGLILRSTHLTGTTTDLGTGLVRCLWMPKNSPERRLEGRFNWMRAGQIAAFILGASIGAYVFPNWHYLAFALPAGLALVSAVLIWLRHR
ncbi:MAG: hypothetical protein K0R17_2444 [Rariglobus sp.]|jgi:uncharacterized membrane protein YoaK (UPF0700 family)|nr:hypothetical protein [Rariglobus sp.]